MIETISIIVMIVILAFFAVGSFYLSHEYKENNER